MEFRIYQWRKRQAMTQEELARRCQTTQQTIAKIEQGLVDPKISTLAKIAEALHIELPELFYTRAQFAAEVNAVVARHKLDLAKVRLMFLNNLCHEEERTPPYHPFWKNVVIVKNQIQVKA